MIITLNIRNLDLRYCRKSTASNDQIIRYRATCNWCIDFLKIFEKESLLR